MCTEFGSVPAERHYRYRAMLVPPVRCWCAEVADGLRKSVCVRGARDGRRVSRAERRLLAVGGPLGRPRYSPTNCGLPACLRCTRRPSLLRPQLSCPCVAMDPVHALAFPWPGWPDERDPHPWRFQALVSPKRDLSLQDVVVQYPFCFKKGKR
jgi:hypothetical protein